MTSLNQFWISSENSSQSRYFIKFHSSQKRLNWVNFLDEEKSFTNDLKRFSLFSPSRSSFSQAPTCVIRNCARLTSLRVGVLPLYKYQKTNMHKTLHSSNYHKTHRTKLTATTFTHKNTYEYERR